MFPMGFSKDPGDGTFHYYTGENMVSREEPVIVKNKLREIGIELNNFAITITGVHVRPRPIGFDFYCNKAQAQTLFKLASQNESLRIDDKSTTSGKFVSYMSDGSSFRQIGSGKSLHLTINTRTGKCNAHIDSIGFVDSCGYDFVRMLGHGYWDLGPHLLPGAFFAFGDTGVAGFMVAPMKGVDGEIRTVFGIIGRW